MPRRALRLPGRPSATALVPLLAISGVIAFTFWQLDPSLLFANTTTAGGDTGAHVILPWYMEHHLLGQFRLTGWSPWWYDGYPQFTFYFPLPALLVAALNLVAPYNVAFKLVTVAGSLLLPVGAYVLGRGAGMRRPGPACLAVATLPFLFDRSFTIYGGNLASTLAGEFGYSLSLSIGLIFLGVVAGGLGSGRRRALAALLLAISALCHFVPAFWVGVGAVVLLLARWDRHRLRYVASVGVAGVAVTGFWVIPFYAGLPYTTSMGWQKVTTYAQSLFPTSLLWVVALAALGAAISLARRRRLGTFLTVMAGISVAMFVLDPTSELYNARLLPFWVLCLYLLAGVAVAELGTLAGEAWAWRQGRWSGANDLGEAALAALAAVGGSAAQRLGNHPELVSALRAALPALSRDRAELAGDPTEWGEAERAAVRLAVALDPEVARAYELKEALGAAAVVTRAHPALAGPALDLWSSLARGSGLEAFQALAWRVHRWRPELLAHAGGARRRAWRLARGRATGVWRGAHVGVRRDLRTFTRARPVAAMATPLVALVVAAGFVVVPLGLSWMPVKLPAKEQSFLPSWIRWNYSGYQGKSTWAEYEALNDTMARVGRQHGCGRAMWEYGPELNDLGTPMALMLLPYWTHGCIDSMEGLLFESSATTPYHFINQAELSAVPSEAMAGLPYGSLDVAAGIRHLQLLGVRYYMAINPQVEAQANRDPALTLVAKSGPWPTACSRSAPCWPGEQQAKTVSWTWDVYLVHGSATVTPLSHQPVVLTGVKRSSAGWLAAAMPWYTHPGRWGTMLAESGPPSWARVPAGSAKAPPSKTVPSTTVSHVHQGDHTISFDVTRLGTPVLVKTSYFPNWQASGARGPWRVAPNLMVVIPTAHHVSVVYGRTAADWLGVAVTAAGLLGVVWLWVRGPIPMPARAGPDGEGPAGRFRRWRQDRRRGDGAEDDEREMVGASRVLDGHPGDR